MSQFLVREELGRNLRAGSCEEAQADCHVLVYSFIISFFFVSTSVFFITVHNGDIKLPGGNLITPEGVFGCRREFYNNHKKKAVEE